MLVSYGMLIIVALLWLLIFTGAVIDSGPRIRRWLNRRKSDGRS